MKLQSLLRALGAPVQDAEEETFELFAQDLPSGNLGFIDSKAPTLDLTIAGRDLTVRQSPGVLSSNRAGGTTGAEWLASPTNPFFAHGVLSPSSLALELGCGISGLVALLLAPRISRYVLTDQPYVAKLVEQNVAENQAASSTAAAPTTAAKAARSSKTRTTTTTPTPNRGSPAAPGRKDAAGSANVSRSSRSGNGGAGGNIRFTPLDWETDEVTSALTGSAGATSFDVVVACDCIYNEALVEPFVSTCVDLCRLRAAETAAAAAAAGEAGTGEQPSAAAAAPCVCVIGQQLRDPLVFEAWATRFTRSFHTWRVPDGLLVAGLRPNQGFVVHVGVLKSDINLEAI
ncbi:hypothetical protein NEMBOFW57_007596 [Staphylotrichum longicolle]|uniref:Diaminohydroxyphosphoribosylamino-pyrimidine deaminase n=1 Tax=Staphylotrichum longicolle TaxID=669026 RepID=A0AAD4HZ80_9PEZI|nr:hypothetical protein NEMBOFW57_007596 [Staphylotrichum longicolle]